eukprot:6891554-Prymnesium_polylepis.1
MHCNTTTSRDPPVFDVSRQLPHSSGQLASPTRESLSEPLLQKQRCRARTRRRALRRAGSTAARPPTR